MKGCTGGYDLRYFLSPRDALNSRTFRVCGCLLRGFYQHDQFVKSIRSRGHPIVTTASILVGMEKRERARAEEFGMPMVVKGEARRREYQEREVGQLVLCSLVDITQALRASFLLTA